VFGHHHDYHGACRLTGNNTEDKKNNNNNNNNNHNNHNNNNFGEITFVNAASQIFASSVRPPIVLDYYKVISDSKITTTTDS
jgi:hypothetical protein